MLEICGTRGRISVRDDSEVEIIRLEEDERTFARSCPSPFEQVSGTVERLTFDDRNNKAQQAATIQNFVAAAQGAGPIQCSLEEGLRSLQIIHGAYLSHWMGRDVYKRQVVDPDNKRSRIVLEGDVLNPVHPPEGCHFHPRCKKCMDICMHKKPELKRHMINGEEHFCACHLYDQTPAGGSDD